jgi:hypothetical protein
MFPTLLDLEVQNQIIKEHIMNAALRQKNSSPRKRSNFRLRVQIVRFGAWLERVGRRLQSQFSPSKLELGSTTLQDVHPQRC